MKIAPLADVKARFSSFVKESEEGPIIVTRNGKPVAMLLSIGDEEEIDRMVLAYSPKFQRILRAAKQQIRDDRSIKHQEFWRELKAKAK
jgi:prevent-host-death family protein